MPNAQLFANVLLIVLTTGGIGVWVYGMSRLRRGLELVPYTPRSPVPWDVVATLPVLLWCLMGLSQTVYSLAHAELPPHALTVGDLAADALAKGAMLLVLLALVIVRGRANAVDCGWQPAKILSDTRLGGLAFLALGFIVYGIQQALVGNEADPQAQHPLVEALTTDHSAPMIALAILSAVVVAPIVEEFMFRVVFQGWLEKVLGRDETPESPNSRRTALRNFSPVLISAALFAVIHLRFHAGVPEPDPIPLFVLALGLGYLYRQTHRIWPSLVVHALLNACSLAIVLLQVFHPPAK